jgi:hypothetical protein
LMGDEGGQMFRYKTRVKGLAKFEFAGWDVGFQTSREALNKEALGVGFLQSQRLGVSLPTRKAGTIQAIGTKRSSLNVPISLSDM